MSCVGLFWHCVIRYQEWIPILPLAGLYPYYFLSKIRCKMQSTTRFNALEIEKEIRIYLVTSIKVNTILTADTN